MDEYLHMAKRLKEIARQEREKPRYGYVQGVKKPVLFVDGKDFKGEKDEKGMW